MVQDPRVTTLLGRLGGLYRDPARVDRDTSSLLKSSVGTHLTPGISPLVENNGDSSHCLVLQGTIAIVFRGMTYQLLVDIYLPPGYPIRPPVSFVRLAENMYLKESHPHVGSDGMVYMPYTHEWNPRTHSLIEMVVAMSSVFSADPPVFTRAAPAPAPPPPLETPSPPPPAYSSYVSSTSNNNNNNSNNNDSERYMQEQIAAIMAKEIEEANSAAEIAHSEQLTQTKKQIEQEIQELTDKKIKLNQHITTMDNKTTEIENWLEKSNKNDTTTNNLKQEINVDDICQPVNKLNTQLLELSAESAALTDVMYFLDRGMYMNQIDCTTHLKMIRKLAKRQFLIRAHLIKINQYTVSQQQQQQQQQQVN
ncbi:UBC-like protein [Fragilariopsis cylindrus CCMP1102]|uniref:UBC-like protein n=1 Tax=Fragilariopsis cylindrus CCMP1102 TaxID=635003 RepID=A0A1E7FKX5_9STRA|nr:UBC-like protein [Fragilariopsis cylindrus CCMP1102]|eukprot:OEU18822.1 UBC-like protein [Fragilariopsis cylindrus CCMP1102]